MTNWISPFDKLPEEDQRVEVIYRGSSTYDNQAFIEYNRLNGFRNLDAFAWRPVKQELLDLRNKFIAWEKRKDDQGED